MNAVSALQHAVQNLPSKSICPKISIACSNQYKVLPDVPPAPPSTPIDSFIDWPASLPTSGEPDNLADPLVICALNDHIYRHDGKLLEAIPFHNARY
jgi:hypothetical protein